MRTIINTQPPHAELKARGKRLTRPRRIILDVVRASEAHPSAAAVYRLVRRRLPRVSLATVYRNLRMLAAEGLLDERAHPAGMRFDGNTAPHDHFSCVACGRIYDVPAPRRPRARLASYAGFEVLSQRIEFYGRCGACRHAAGPTSTAPTHIRRGRGEPHEGAPTQRRKPWQDEASRAPRATRT
jgi:Fur family ferric uptake transcriptional regulator